MRAIAGRAQVIPEATLEWLRLHSPRVRSVPLSLLRERAGGSTASTREAERQRAYGSPEFAAVNRGGRKSICADR